MIIYEKSLKYCLVYFFPSVDLFTERTIGYLERFLNRLWNISRSTKTHAFHSNASDWQICKNKQEFFDFWAISYRFEHIVMLIIIQMYFVLLATISLLFVWEGHFWIIFKKGRAYITYQFSIGYTVSQIHKTSLHELAFPVSCIGMNMNGSQ